MVTTSYFASKAPSGQKVCIAKKAPRYFKGLHVKNLAPSDPWAKDWQTAYLADLNRRFPGGTGLADLLSSISSTIDDPILCCYEYKPEECHRHLLAEFIEKQLGITVPEWTQK